MRERKTLRLTLKIVADVALVGVPNAGKSTFLSAVTRAKPKIANVRSKADLVFLFSFATHFLFCVLKYPFTTVIPNLGVWVPTEVDYGEATDGRRIEGSGSEGLVLCVS